MQVHYMHQQNVLIKGKEWTQWPQEPSTSKVECSNPMLWMTLQTPKCSNIRKVNIQKQCYWGLIRPYGVDYNWLIFVRLFNFEK
jgi:hypothetical protein